MEIRSLGFIFDEKRVHSVSYEIGKDPVHNTDRVEKLTLETDSWHKTVTDQTEIQQCFDEIPLLKGSKVADTKKAAGK